MGYFSNGTEGQMWEEENCDKCVHQDQENGCPILLIHYMHNYDWVNEDDHPARKIMNILIPRRNDGFNDKCSMLHLKEQP